MSGKTDYIHFIGIGGIGVSALARYYASMGASVTGSDLVSSEITEDLGKEGIRVVIGRHKKINIPKNATKVIYSPAIAETNLELKSARERKILIHSYPEAVGELTRHYDTVTIAGSHGKTTTTALVALMLEEGYYDPTVFIGAKIKEFGNTNFRRGRGPYLVLEADEWNRSFLNYHPKYAIVTNIDAEHLDTYKTLDGVESVFAEYLSKVPASGKIIANADNPTLCRVAKQFSDKVVWYSLKDERTDHIRRILRIPGEHNVSNALAAWTFAQEIGVREDDILRALSQFTGAWRRFELRGMVNGAVVIADYAHHPTELVATLQAARARFPFRRIWCVFQPHQRQRLQYLWNEFIGAFDSADRIVILPVYDVAGREKKIVKKTVNSPELAGELQQRGKNALFIESFEETADYITMHARSGDIILMVGAGDIYSLTKEFITHGGMVS